MKAPHAERTVRGPLNTTIPELALAVSHSDQLAVAVTRGALCHVLEIALKSLALASIGRGMTVDIGNGYLLSCTLTEAPGHFTDTAAGLLANHDLAAAAAAANDTHRHKHHGPERRTR